MEITEVMMLIKIPGSESVTEINRKYVYSRELNISSLSFIHPELTESHLITAVQ